MGWSSGGEIFHVVASKMVIAFGNKQKQQQIEILEFLIDALEDGDCDVLDEEFGISAAADTALINKGYHMWVHGSCDYNDDYSACIGCGWEQR